MDATHARPSCSFENPPSLPSPPLDQVTKPRFFHKPSYASLTSSLRAMRSHCLSSGVVELCMPQLGCGLDRLQWERVLEVLHEVFADMDINITVYYL